MDNEDSEVDFRVRAAVYDGVMTAGPVPLVDELVATLGLARERVAAALERLAAGRALVLQHESREVLMANPFSAVPTPFAVRAAGKLYYGNCIWDALGIPAALGADARIDCSCGCCGEAMSLAVGGDALRPADGVVHFAIAAHHWWDDIVFN